MINITENGQKKLKTAGKYCPNDVDVTVAVPPYAKEVSEVPSINTGNIIYNTTNDSYYIWEHNITNTLIHCTANSGNPTSIAYNGVVMLVYTADSGCTLPSNITVIGASYTWTQATGTLVLSNPTGNVRISIDASDPLAIPLNFTANTAGSMIALEKYNGPAWTGSYSLDGINWMTYEVGLTGGIVLENVGDKVYFKGDITDNFYYFNRYLKFSMTGSIAASGNINSMYISSGFENLTTLVYTDCFTHLFFNCTSLTSAPLLPATILSDDCYRDMFYGCTSLTTAPELPATTLANSCYQEMFCSCTSLTVAPTLSATTLANNCYREMFSECTSLTTAPALPATTLAENCYFSMFRYCEALINPPHLPATTLAECCYNEMFAHCIKLTTVPALPATTLADRCYTDMFEYCFALQVSDTQTTAAPSAWIIPTSGTFTNTYSQLRMFDSCAGTRSSDDMPGAQGQSYTYYTQNAPV